MKFLQFTADWGRIHIDGISNVQNLNELELGLGRSLHRPQNKQVQVQSNININNENEAEDGLSLLHRTSFIDYMRSKPHKLPDDLQYIIYYALCLQCDPIDPIPPKGSPSPSVDPSHIPTPVQGPAPVQAPILFSAYDGLKMLYNHIKSLDKFSGSGNGKTAFLYPIYGIGELAQAFCRMCAVWGGIYMLRVPVSKCEILSNANTSAASATSAVGDKDGSIPTTTTNPTNVVSVVAEEETYTCTNIVCHYQNRVVYKLDNLDSTGTQGGGVGGIGGIGGIVTDTNTDTNSAACNSNSNHSYLVYRTSVIVGSLLTPANSNTNTNSGNNTKQTGNHCIGILPPNTINLSINITTGGTTTGTDTGDVCINYHHPYAIHIIQLASKAAVCPDEHMLLYFSSTIDDKFYNKHRAALGCGHETHNTEKKFIAHMSKLLMNTVVDVFKQFQSNPNQSNSIIDHSIPSGSNANTNTNTVTELFYTTRVKRITPSSSLTPHSGTGGSITGSSGSITGSSGSRSESNPILYCGLDTKQCIDVNNYFIEAKSLFDLMFPGEIFMKSADDVDDADGTGDVKDVEEDDVSGAADDTDIIEGADGDVDGIEEDSASSTVQNTNSNNNDTATTTASTNVTSVYKPSVEDEEMEFLLATLQSVS